MGDDGHTASIFPGKSGELPLLSENFVEIPFIDKLQSLRMTLTSKTLLGSKNVWFLITGKKKADVVQKVFSSNYNPEVYPVQVISKGKGNIKFFMDEEACSKL